MLIINRWSPAMLTSRSKRHGPEESDGLKKKKPSILESFAVKPLCWLVCAQSFQISDRSGKRGA